MAKTIQFKVRLDIDGKQQVTTATASVAELEKKMNKAKQSTTSFRNAMVTLGQTVTVIQGLSNSMNSLLGVMNNMSAAYNNSQQLNTQLTTVMRQRMDATDEDIKKVKEVIGVQKQLGVIGGAVQMRGAQQIATFLSEKQTLQTLIPAMNNLLAQQKGLNATEEDAYGIANLMGKAMQGQTSALKRVGITFSDAEAQVMQFGSESERASMLAQIITNNVGKMNEQLGKTDAGKIKIASNQFAAMKVQIGQAVTQWLPMVSMTAQTLTVATSVITLATSFKGLYLMVAKVAASMNLLTIATNALRTAKVSLSAISTVLTARFNGMTVGATTAAVATRALAAAVKSVMIAGGVTAIIWALSEAFSALSTSNDKANSELEETKARQQAAAEASKQQAKEIASVSTEMQQNIAQLKNFKGSKTEEKKLVEQMNTKYGESMGYYSTVSQWYTALTANSKTYCNQMINEIRIRNLANQAAEAESEAHSIKYDDNGKLRKYSTANKTQAKWVASSAAGEGHFEDVQIAGSSDAAKANKAYTAAIRRSQNARSQMEKLSGQSYNYTHTAGYSATPTTSGGGTTHATSGGSGGGSTTSQEANIRFEAFKDYYENINKASTSKIEQAVKEKTSALSTASLEAEFNPDAKDNREKMAGRKSLFENQQRNGKSNDDISKLLDTGNGEGLSNLLGDGMNLDDAISALENMDSVLQSCQGTTGAFASQWSGLATTIKSGASATDVAGAALSTLGQSLEQMGADGPVAKVGAMAAAIGQCVLGFATASAQASSLGPWGWLAFVGAGLGTLASMISTIGSFATGGIVPGNSTSGDKLYARVNSGEMILNTTQQANLFKMLNHQTTPNLKTSEVQLDMNTVRSFEPQGVNVHLQSRIRGGDIVQSVANSTRTWNKSGRRSKIVV